MRPLLILVACLALSAQANAPTDARLHCGTLTGKGAIQVPMPDGRMSLYIIDCKHEGLTA